MEGLCSWRLIILALIKTMSTIWFDHKTSSTSNICYHSKFSTKSTSSQVSIDSIQFQESKQSLRDTSTSWRHILHSDKILALSSMCYLLKTTLFSLRTKIQCKQRITKCQFTKEIPTLKLQREATRPIGPISWTNTPLFRLRSLGMKFIRSLGMVVLFSGKRTCLKSRDARYGHSLIFF